MKLGEKDICMIYALWTIWEWLKSGKNLQEMTCWYNSDTRIRSYYAIPFDQPSNLVYLHLVISRYLGFTISH